MTLCAAIICMVAAISFADGSYKTGGVLVGIALVTFVCCGNVGKPQVVIVSPPPHPIEFVV